LIRIRNPWGQGEWTGKFADEDEAWDDHKGLKEKLKYVFKGDGNWWMKYEDFCANSTKYTFARSSQLLGLNSQSMENGLATLQVDHIQLMLKTMKKIKIMVALKMIQMIDGSIIHNTGFL